MKLFILFGSQTGNAREVAFDLAFEAKRRLIETCVKGLDDALEEFFNIKIAVFVVSTTGQGDVPDNMRQFWRGIMSKSLSGDFLNGMFFTVFGLGDSTYQNFNVVARKLWVRLKQLGGKSIIEKGLGDDIHDFGYEAEYHPWCEKLWRALTPHYPLLPQIVPTVGLLPPLYTVSEIESVSASFPAQPLEVQSFKTLSRTYGQTFQLTFESLPHSPGDALSIYGRNSSESVRSLMSRLNWPDRKLSIRKSLSAPFDFPEALPSEILLSDLLTNYIDLHHPASRYFIFVLSHFSEGLHQKKLEEMSRKDFEGRNEYHRYITKEYRNVLEVLHDFSSISHVPLEYFLESVRVIRPREFSIAGNEELRVLVSRVSFSTPLGRTVEGFCSGFLAKVRKNDRICAKVVAGSFKMPTDDCPLILVATGTGIAPLWAMLESRVKAGFHRNLLFFGTRHPDHDFYFKEEIEKIEKAGLCRAFVAFSQLTTKTYVQDLIPGQWELVNSYILAGGFVYICGKAKTLVKSVKNSLKTCFERFSSSADSSELVKTLEQSKRLNSENW